MIAQAVFLLEHGQTDRQTALPTPAAAIPAGVGNENKQSVDESTDKQTNKQPYLH